MALKSCGSCKREIDEACVKCPHCGNKERKSSPVVGIVIVLFVLIGGIGSFLFFNGEDEVSEEASEEVVDKTSEYLGDEQEVESDDVEVSDGSSEYQAMEFYVGTAAKNYALENIRVTESRRKVKLSTLIDSGYVLESKVTSSNSSLCDGYVLVYKESGNVNSDVYLQCDDYKTLGYGSDEGIAEIVLENYVGREHAEVKAQLEAAGLIVVVESEGEGETGIINKQSPLAYKRVYQGDTITLYIPEVVDVVYPDFTVGHTVADVVAFCEEEGIVLVSEQVGEGDGSVIVFQSIEAGSKVLEGQTLTIRVE